MWNDLCVTHIVKKYWSWWTNNFKVFLSHIPQMRHNLHNLSQKAHESITNAQTSTESTNILHFILTLILVWSRHIRLVAFENKILIAFNKAKSLSLTITWGNIFALKNKLLNIWRTQMKLFSHFVSNNAKVVEKSIICVEDGCCPFKVVFDEDLYVVFDEVFYVHFMYFLFCFKYVLVSA